MAPTRLQKNILFKQVWFFCCRIQRGGIVDKRLARQHQVENHIGIEQRADHEYFSAR